MPAARTERGGRMSFLLCPLARCLHPAGARYQSMPPRHAGWSADSIFIQMTSSSKRPNRPPKAEPKPSEPQAPLTKADVRNIFYGLMLGMFLSALNQTIVATALPTIGRDFGDFENLS